MIDRLSERSVFAALRTANRATSGPVRVRYLPPSDSASAASRVGFALGRHLGGAVRRNRIRRRLRAALVDLDRADGLPPGYYLVSAAAEAHSCAYPELVAHVERAVQGVIRSSVSS